MKVFVTGGCGFLGSHVCEYFLKKGHQVISFDNMTKHELARTGFAAEAARNYNWDYLQKLGVEMIKGDIRNFEQLLDQAQGCHYLIHTAAQPAMTISWEDPRLDISTNVVGTFNVLEAARKLTVPMANCATIHIYGNLINETITEEPRQYRRDPVGIDESHPTLEGSLTPLHASKAAADTYVKVYLDTYNLEAASFRLTGIYGTRQFGGEDHGWVANFAIRSILDRPVTIFGTGKQVRDIIYATDVCAAFEAFYNTRESGIYNIGGGSRTAISLLDCIEFLEQSNGRPPKLRFEPDRHGDLRYFVCDIAQARKRLNWEPRVMPGEGVEMLLQWIRENLEIFSQEVE